MKKRIALGVVAAVALGVTGCSTTDDAGSDSEGVNIVYAVPSSWANAGALQENIKLYEEESGNTVEVLGIPDEQHDTTVQTRLTSGGGIDVFAGLNDIQDSASVMIEITDPSFEDRMNPAVFESMFATDGKLYSYPTADALATFGVLYNKEVFEAAGVAEAPTSLQDMTAALEKVKASGVTPLYLAGKDGWTLLQHRNSVNADFLATNPNVAAELGANETTWSQVPGFEQQYDALAGWATGGLVNADMLTASYEQSLEALATGQTGAIINGTWAISELRKQNADMELGFFAVPNAEGDTVVGLSRPNTMHIAKSSKVQDDAQELLEFLIAPEQAERFIAAAPGIPAFLDVTVAEPDPAIEDVQVYVEDGRVVSHFDNVGRFPTPQDDIIALYQELIAGRIDVAAFGEGYDQAWINAGKTAGLEGF
ncbi:UNVERIFIED_CONTAM: ABC transporter substrate-binding protein [Microbacterium sp. SLM126]